MTKKHVGLAVLTVLLPCLLLAVGMLFLPYLRGSASEAEPLFRYEISDPATEGIVLETGIILPDIDYGDVVVIPEIPFSYTYPPEELFWISYNVEADSLLGREIPSALSSSRPLARILTDGNDIAEAAEAINSLSYANGRLPLSNLEGVDFYLLRFSRNEAVKVYETGHVAFSSWQQKIALPTQNGVDAFKLLSALYDKATDSFTYVNGAYEFFAYAAEGVTAPSSAMLKTGGRIYILGDTLYAYPATHEEIMLRYASSSLLLSLSEKDVRYLIDLAEILRQRGGKAVVAGALADTDYVVDLNGLAAADRFAPLRQALFGWLTSLSSSAVCSVKVMTQSDGTVTDAFFAESTPDDFWYFPDMSSTANADRLLAHILGTEDRSEMDFPCFHFGDDGIDYYPSLAENVFIRLLSNSSDVIEVVPVE